MFRYLDLISYDGSTELLVGDEFNKKTRTNWICIGLTERVETECPCNLFFLGVLTTLRLAKRDDCGPNVTPVLLLGKIPYPDPKAHIPKQM